ncbi:Uncharacterized protein SCF082_LOCUS11004 [Durusdinium trenchii]|uniref:Uncharacterized protein n=1 Tax=Durusdinium trenchii TaxID=1381693 RepID=A0ABP0JA68_9DINO
MKSGEEFEWGRATGKTMETYVHSHQDKSRNAMSKALEASFVAWVEELRADQAQFSSEKVLMEKEGAKARNKIIRQLEAESTVMPASRAWLREMTTEMGNSPEDHAVILWLNCPALGVISAGRMSFILNYISNVLSDFPLNSICFVVHPNRAGNDLSLPERNLKVKNVIFVFEPESVYGKREGALQGLCVVSNNPKNIFRQTRGFKTGVVHSISMLQRSEMVKPDHVSPRKSVPHLGRAFTDVQEQRQVAGGTDFIQKTLQSFSVPSAGAIAMMDLHGCDGCPALSCVEDIASGKRSVCGTICLDHTGADMLQRVGNKIYESCRSQSLNLPGFPAFEPVLSALRSQNVVDRHKSYRVSAQQHDALYILEVYAKKWLATESTKERAQQVIEDHNKEFNPTEKTEEAEIKTEPPPAKRIKLETMTEQDISKMPKEADEVLANAEGRWFSFTVSAAETFFVLERKDLANHLAKLECVDTAVTLQSLICDLQDAGEVKLELSHHKEESGTFTSSKPLVFCLDEPPQDIISVSKKKGKKGAKGTQLTAKNFGSFLSVSKLKTASDTVRIAWRCRFLVLTSHCFTVSITPHYFKQLPAPDGPIGHVFW